MSELSDLITYARGEHERVLTDTCEARRTTTGPLDEATGTYLKSSLIAYQGPCRLKATPPGTADLGGGRSLIARFPLEVPHDAPVLLAGDLVAIGSRSFTVSSTAVASTATIKRYVVEERL